MDIRDNYRVVCSIIIVLFVTVNKLLLCVLFNDEATLFKFPIIMWYVVCFDSRIACKLGKNVNSK